MKGKRDHLPFPLERRRDEIRKYHALGYKRWKEQTGYGKRWAVEGFFRMKRKFGEDTAARKPQTLTAEAMQRAWAYDEMVCYAKKRTRKGKASTKTRRKHGPGFIQQST
ncbi:MAG: hypothetical protein ACP5SK_04110 [Thermoprotei archaeon]